MKNKDHIRNLLAILVCIIIFVIIPVKYTLPINLQNADNYHEELTAFSLNVVNNWLIDGIFSDQFIMYPDYASVEFENNSNRNMYLSYPPGALIPLYLTAKVSGKSEISIELIKHFVQLEYFLSVFVLSLLFYICLNTIEVTSGFLKIFLPVLFAALWAYLPYNIYYMNNVYFADQAVIFLSILFFLIEMALYAKELKKYKVLLQISSGMVMFTGILTDYYFFCIAFVAVFFRILRNFSKHSKKSFIFKLFHNNGTLMVSIFTASSLFLIQLLSVPNGFKLLELTFSVRSGPGDEWGGLDILMRHFGNGFTVLFIPLLIGVVVFCLIFPWIRKNDNEKKIFVVRGLSLIVFSAVLHTILLREHSIVHEFSMLKYNLVFVFIIFTLTCWLYLNYMSSGTDRKKKYWKFLCNLIIGLVIVLILVLQIYDRNFYGARKNTADHSIARFIKANTNYYDVIYSPDYEINWNPPQDLAISKKRVYKVSSPQEILYNNLPDKAVINILLTRDSLKREDWNKIIKQKSYFSEAGELYLFKIPKNSFSSALQ
ncbi:MAG TPA: hypothetical protein PLV50_10370 [Smithella sp.]|nr:hypothetical protein [Smithella sp.]MDM7985757.1 hypothetical protein [Smithella sp.]HNY49925.1 hypothetical protein [Smithella sp.]HOG90934.1 hypothetical protein [Smithella sp.]HOU50614.1 hypothetical protein [Smithella sp.]